MAKNTITQRITLVGGDEVRAAFERIGESGKAAFLKLQDAIAKTQAIDRFKKSVENLAARTNEIRESVDLLKLSFAEFAVSIGNAAQRTIGLGATLIGLTAGFALVVKNAVMASAGATTLVHSWDALITRATSVKNSFFAAFGPAIQKIIEAVADTLSRHEAAIQRFAETLASRVEPVVNDFIDALNGVAKEGNVFVPIVEGARDLGAVLVFAFGVAQTAITGLVSVLDTVADAINAIFGTELTGKQLLFAAAILKLTGIFSSLLSGIQLVAAAIGFLVTLFGAPAVAIVALGAAIGFFVVKAIQDFGGLQAIVTAVWDEIGSAAGDATQWIADTWTTLVELISSVAGGMGDALVDLFTTAASDIVAAFQTIVEPITNILTGIINLAKSALALVGAAESGGDGGDGGAGFARGGYLRGPGSKTSDSIPIRASNGEYIVNAKATDYYGVGAFNALNRMDIPLQRIRDAIRGFRAGGLTRTISNAVMPGFASGGQVTFAAGGGSTRPVEIHIGDQVVRGLNASTDAIDQLRRHATKSRLRSAGRAPNWQGG